MVFEELIGLPLANSKNFACFVVDAEGNFVYANEAFLNLYGYPKDELLGKPVVTIIEENSREQSFELFQKYMRDEALPPNHWTTITSSGIVKRATASITRLEKDGAIYISVILHPLNEDSNLHLLTKLKKENQTAKVGTFEYQPFTKRIEWSRGMYDIFELSPDEGVVPLQELRTYASLEDLQLLDKAARECLLKNKPCDISISLLQKDGSTKHVRVIAELKDGNLKKGTISGVAIDISDQLNTNLALRKVSIQRELAVQGGEIGIWEMDLHTYEAFYNNMWHEMLGYAREEIEFTGEFFFSLLHPDDKHLPMEAMENYLNGTIEKFDIEIRMRCKDGSYKWIHDRAKFVAWDKDGKPTKLSGTHVDITSQKRVAESLEIANKRLRSLIDASPMAIYSITKDGIVNDFWNPAAEELYGWKRNKVIGSFLPQLTEADLPEFKVHIEEIRKGKTLIKEKFIRTNVEGKEISIEVTTGPIFDKEGNLTEILVITSDITELEQKRLDLEASVKEKETLLQEIHHRVKNNLAVVSGLLHLQAFKSEDDEHIRGLAVAQSRIRTIAMVHELLYQANDFSKINLKIYYEKLVELIEQNMQMGHGNIKHDFDINVSYLNINQAIPLGLLLNELLTNSIKYAFDGEVNTLRISMNQKDNDITFVYEDSGPGFDTEKVSTTQGIGWELIKTLMQQLNASYEFDTSNRFFLKMKFENDLYSRGAHSNLKQEISSSTS